MLFALTVLIAYLLGSIPTGYIVARARGIDIRSVGSGNIGATNVFRILGKKAGVFVLLVDGLKGYAACRSGVWLGALAGWVPASASQAEWLPVIGAFLGVLGHNYTCWLRFKGGKGIATSAGALIALLPVPFLVILGVWLGVFGVSRYVSLASIAAAAALPFATWHFARTPLLVGVATLMSVLAIYKHRSNIQRLLEGNENRIGGKKS